MAACGNALVYSFSLIRPSASRGERRAKKGSLRIPPIENGAHVNDARAGLRLQADDVDGGIFGYGLKAWSSSNNLGDKLFQVLACSLLCRHWGAERGPAFDEVEMRRHKDG